jgi:amino acid transporter
MKTFLIKALIFIGITIALLPLIMVANESSNIFINICGLLYLFLLIVAGKAYKYYTKYQKYKKLYTKIKESKRVIDKTL